MYGGSGGEAGQLLAVLRRRFPQASGFVETAARAGEEGRVVRSVLGRTCPPPSAAWRAMTAEAADPEAERDPGAGRAARARGRFTRNFVVQASAADWALVLLASLRRRLAALAAGRGRAGAGPAPHLVFFQHDEVIVHCPAADGGPGRGGGGRGGRRGGPAAVRRDPGRVPDDDRRGGLLRRRQVSRRPVLSTPGTTSSSSSLSPTGRAVRRGATGGTSEVQYMQRVAPDRDVAEALAGSAGSVASLLRSTLAMTLAIGETIRK